MFIIFFFGLDLPYLWALHAGFEQRHQKGLGEKKNWVLVLCGGQGPAVVEEVSFVYSFL